MKKNKSKAENEIEKNKDKRGFKKLPLYIRIIVIVLSSVIFIGGAGAGGIFLYINSINSSINSITTSEVENILTTIESPREPVTILVLGRDSRDAENDYGRADTIMLFYLNPEEGTGSLLSIPRDTLVEIPGHGEDKINAAYAYGGEELMIKTVSSFLDAEINHYVTLDFEGFVRLIDALGGVDITIDRPIVDPKSGANFSAGNHHLTGEQALSYTRSRSTELGDIGRIQRQQQLFKELLRQKLNVKYLSSVPYYFNILVENTRTDLDIITILKYSKAALSFNSENFETAIIPSRSDWIENGTISVQIPDIEEARAMWERIISGEPASKYNAEYVEIDKIVDSMTQDTEYRFKIKVKNTGALTWNRNGNNPVYLSYHWIDFNSKEKVVFDGKRSIIPEDGVNAGGEIVFDLTVISPSEPGEYILQIDLVHEGITWFSSQGVPSLEKFITVDISYAARYNDGGTTPTYVDKGQEFNAQVKVRNNGFLLWEHEGDKYRMDLGTHWINRDTGEMIIWDGNRGLLPEDVSYNEEVIVDIKIKAPDKPGRYILQYDMVHERITWFSEKGVIPLEVNVDVGRVIDKSITSRTYIIISNGNGISGSAVKFKDYLKVYGFKILGLSNADSYNYEKTVIYYSKENKEKADQLAIIFSSYEMKELSSSIFKEIYGKDADVAIIVGKDYLENIQ
ncbi:MAG: LCP family protein [Actinobacteria bacterium]|nr:LCP family protein [Actinomycetota bacterium]